MGLSNRTRVYLQGEGINHPDDLLEFLDKDAWKQIGEACRRPPQIANAAGAGLVDQQPFQLPAKSLLRLQVAAKVVEFYQRTARPLTAANLRWVRMSNFKIEWTTLVDRKGKNDELTLPSISRSLPIVPFFEAYDTFCEEFIGQAGCPIKWVYRDAVAVPAAVPAQDTDQPYSTQHGSVAGEMVARLSHAHPLYRVDNATGYSQLVTATLGTSYASTIAPFKRTRNGRAALLALKAQFAGPAHWDKEVKSMSDFLLTSKWTGTTGFSLHQFLAKHRSSFNSLQRCADHVSVELPNERTRVGYLLDNIDTNDRDVSAAMSSIRLDDTVDPTSGDPTGMRNDFEAAVAFLLPHDPVKKKRGAKRASVQISAATSVSDPNDKPEDGGKNVRFKPTYGKTGVELRYYKLKEWKKLTKEQQDEVREHRKKNGDYKNAWSKGKGKGPGRKGGLTKARVAAMIAEAASEKEKEQAEQESMRKGLISDLKEMVDAQVAAIVSAGGPPRKALQRAGANVSVASVEKMAEAGTQRAKDQDDAVDRCADSLMSKFNAMGTKSKAAKKTG